jgi:hypothetical protein
VGLLDRLRATRDLRLLQSHRSWGPTPWRSSALPGLPYPAPLAPVLWGCVPQPWSPSVTMLCPLYNLSPLSLQLLVGSAVGTRYMYYVRSRYKMLKQKKKKKKKCAGGRPKIECSAGEDASPQYQWQGIDPSSGFVLQARSLLSNLPPCHGSGKQWPESLHPLAAPPAWRRCG